MALSLIMLNTVVSTTAWAQSEEIDAYSNEEGEAPPEKSNDTESTSLLRSPTDAVKGHIGLGYFSSEVPFGLRYWLSRDTAVDLGFTGQYVSGDLEAYTAGADIGFVQALAHYHYSVVFARVGARFLTNNALGDYAGSPKYWASGNAFLGAELFLGALGFPNVSVQGGYGFSVDYAYDGGSRLLMGTTNGGLSLLSAGTLGFHIYL
ncbi:hypothetical protein KAI87_13265 [Myxococcota bacterium]|nr:hypothetical protein [Myxococcota bacterium]